jgi:nucleoid-associated protein YgaU
MYDKPVDEPGDDLEAREVADAEEPEEPEDAEAEAAERSLLSRALGVSGALFSGAATGVARAATGVGGLIRRAAASRAAATDDAEDETDDALEDEELDADAEPAEPASRLARLVGAATLQGFSGKARLGAAAGVSAAALSGTLLLYPGSGSRPNAEAPAATSPADADARPDAPSQAQADPKTAAEPDPVATDPALAQQEVQAIPAPLVETDPAPTPPVVPTPIEATPAETIAMEDPPGAAGIVSVPPPIAEPVGEVPEPIVPPLPADASAAVDPAPPEVVVPAPVAAVEVPPPAEAAPLLTIPTPVATAAPIPEEPALPPPSTPAPAIEPPPGPPVLATEPPAVAAATNPDTVPLPLGDETSPSAVAMPVPEPSAAGIPNLNATPAAAPVATATAGSEPFPGVAMETLPNSDEHLVTIEEPLDDAVTTRAGAQAEPVVRAGAPGPRSAVQPVRHVVQRGENFWTIARLYYGSGRFYKALWKANQSVAAMPEDLYVGAVIQIPDLSQLDPRYIDPPSGGSRSVVQPRAQAEPPRRDPATLQASAPVDLEPASDTIVMLPESRTGKPAAETRLAPARPVAAERTYVVRAHDTPRSIARDQLGDPRRAGEIIQLNAQALRGLEALEPGMELLLPR